MALIWSLIPADVPGWCSKKQEYRCAGRLRDGLARGGLETGPDGDSRGDQ